MAGWHHRLNGHEFKQAPGDSGRQRSLACCSLWGHKESDMTGQLNNIQVSKRWCKPGALNSLRRGVSFAPRREAEDARGCIPVHERRSFQRRVGLLASIDDKGLQGFP